MKDANLSNNDNEAQRPTQVGPRNNDRRGNGHHANTRRRLEVGPQYKPRYNSYTNLNRDIAMVYLATGDRMPIYKPNTTKNEKREEAHGNNKYCEFH